MTYFLEQIPLNLEGEDELKSLSLEKLESLYREKVGIPSRNWDKATLILAINDPEQERLRVRELDRAEDSEDLKTLYRR